MVVRLEGIKDISCILEKLTALNYDVVTDDKKVAYIYRKNLNSNDLKGDIKSVKNACNFSGTLKMIYGTSTASI